MSILSRLCTLCAAVLLFPSIANAQILYLSDTPNLCCPAAQYESNHYYIYAHSPENGDFFQASFRIDTDAFNASEIEFIIPMPGVAILSGDIFSGITLEWPPQVLDHQPVLEIKIIDSAPSFGEVWVTDATMYQLGGESVPLEPKLSILASTCHCNGCLWHIIPPDTVEAAIGKVTSISVLIGAECDGALAAVIDVTDTQGWVDSWSPTGLYLPNICGECFIDMEPVDIVVLVPEGTPVGTISEVLVSDTATFLVRAVKSVPVEEKTWGQIKAIFDRRE